MLKKIYILAICSFSVAVHAQEYADSPNFGPIHTTTLESTWCGNLAVSTKVGKLSSSGKCTYLKETQVHPHDSCDALELNGFLLQQDAGSGFNCAATHVHSNVTGLDGLDEYNLIVNSKGEFVNTTPSRGNINLQNILPKN